ncbi:MAG: FHA domain-containing protein [Proteobacteria bacterium]|nr:FHA domain-containing protein [Pseudomonadota bacterium]
MLALVCLGLLWPALAATASTLTEHMSIGCAQDTPTELRCQYRLLEGGQLQAVVAEWQDHTVSARLGAAYPADGDTTALLVLVDTSDPARAPALRAAIGHIDALLAAAPAHFRLGLAAFDTDLRLLAPLGADAADIRKAAAGLIANGRTTELYRNVRDALRVLEKSKATRKALLVLSDGLAEDFAYHHDDVVSMARANDIVIDTIGYPRSVPQSVALQTLRRLSDDTGGHYLQANHPDFKLPVEALPHVLGLLDAGGTLDFDLAPLVAAGAAGALELSLAFQTRDQSFLVLAPVTLPKAAPSAAPAPVSDVAPPLSPAAPAPLPAAPIPANPHPIDLNAGRVWPWFGILLALSTMILLAVLVLYWRVRRPPAASADGSARPLAWLQLAELPYTRHAITATPWRIGRGRNCDVVLDDHSVSRLHAEVRCNDQGVLTLHDLESLNGVFVNDTRIESIQLRENDMVDIGDVRLRFTLHDESHAAQEATVMVRTRTPT